MSGDDVIYAFRRNVVVAASAGTGKTHRLTALYVLLTLGLTSMGQDDDESLADPVLPSSIVATTFSRAAAAEIAQRIEPTLARIAEGDLAGTKFEPAIRARLARAHDPIDDGELRLRARAALENFSRARIDTLHAVAGRIVRQNALAFGVPPDSRVLEEEEAEVLGNFAVDEALDEALVAGGERADAAKTLITAATGIYGARFQVRRLLDRLDEEGISPRNLALFDHETDARRLSKRVHDVAKAVAAEGHSVFKVAASALARAMSAQPDELLPDAAREPLEELFATRTPPKSKQSPADEELAELIVESKGTTKLEKAHTLIATLVEAPSLRGREAEVRAIITAAHDKLGAAKRKRGALGFGDLLRIARGGLCDHADVAARERDGISALLVDELQDTSRVQRDLVYLLRERDGSGRAPGAPPAAEHVAPHGLFVVGDRKQSIYAFRGADVAVFSQLCVELAGQSAATALALPPPPDVPVRADFVALRESRRSGEGILRFVNAYAAFDFASGRSGPPRPFEIEYGPGEQLVAADASAPGEVILVRDDGDSPDDAAPIVREASGAAREAHVAAALVATSVRDAGSLLAFKDVAILARRRSTIPFVEVALARLDVPYIVAGRALYDAHEVRDIAALLRLLLDPRDRLALATVVRGPMVGLSDPGLALLSAPRLTIPLLSGWSASAGVDPNRLEPVERARLEAFRAKFKSVRRAILRLSPSEAIRAAMTAFDFDRIIAALPRAEARLGNLDRLVSLARRRGGTLSGFVRWLDRRIADEADEAEAAVFSAEDDAVRLTTIHASKGLDFPMVVLVDLNAQPRGETGGVTFLRGDGTAELVLRHFGTRPASGAQLAPQLIALHTPSARLAQKDASARDQAERRRLTYVAMTRARSTLALIAPAAPARNGSAFQSLEQGLTASIPSGLVREAPALDVLARAATLPPPPPREASVVRAHLPLLPNTPPARSLAIAATPFAMFAGCPRRFRFRHLLGFEEPVDTGQLDLFAASAPPRDAADDLRSIDGGLEGDARALGRAAHRVIERWPRDRLGVAPKLPEVVARLVAEGLSPDDAATARIGAKVAAFIGSKYLRDVEGSHIERELGFVLEIEAEPRALHIRGAIDFVADRPGGSIDIVDYKLSTARTDLSAYAFQLRTYALAVHRRYPRRNIVAGVAFLGSDAPIFLRGTGQSGALTDSDHAAFDRELAALARLLATARHEDRYEGVPLDRCRALHCGFVQVCHGEKA